jgi:hypothetical protein
MVVEPKGILDLVIHRVHSEWLTAEGLLFSTVDEQRLPVACVNFGFAEHGYATSFLQSVEVLVDHVLAIRQAPVETD